MRSISPPNWSAGSTSIARRWPAIALTTDTSALTAIGNDYGFEPVFERQLRGLGRAGDVLHRHFHLGPLAEHRGGAEGGTRNEDRDRRT